MQSILPISTEANKVMELQSIVRRLSNVSTCAVADAMAQLKLRGHIEDLRMYSPQIVDNGNRTICGLAHTVRLIPIGGAEVEPQFKGHHVDAAPEGSVIVVSSPPGSNAVWGGIMSAGAQARKCLAAVIDGNCRDLDESRSRDFPVFAKGVSVHGNRGVNRAYEMGTPITIGNCVIRPNDIIHADMHGVLILPQERAGDILLKAEEQEAQDAAITKAIDGGMSVEEAIRHNRH